MRTILFICTGNTCRSPMAEAIGQAWVTSSGESDLLVASAGVAAASGMPVTLEAEHALARLGLEVSGLSKPLTADMIRRCEIVFAMTESHAAAARRLVEGEGEHASKIVPLDPAGDIEDPIGYGQDVYDDVAARLTELIPVRMKEMLSHEDRAGVGSSGD